MPFTNVYIIFLFGFLILSCTEWDLEREGFTEIITVGASEIGFNSAILLGDIERLRNGTIVERGFVYSVVVKDDAGLRISNPDVVTIESRDIDPVTEGRAFIARATDLTDSTEYYFRAYVIIQEEEEQIAYGNIDQFTTISLSLSIESVRRLSEGCPTTAITAIKINGFAFGGNTEVNLVYSVGIENLYPTLENGILIAGNTPDEFGIVEIPINVDCNNSYFLRTVVNPRSPDPFYGDVIGFTTVENGLWANRGLFTGTGREGPVSFLLKDQMIMGSGNRGLRILSDFHSYDLTNDQWSDLGSFDALELTAGSGFSVDGNGYVTTGRIDYSKCTGSSSGTCPDYENDRNRLCPTAGIGECAYYEGICDPTIILRLLPCDCYNNDLFQYSPNTQNWANLDTFPGQERKSSVVINKGNEVYLGMGFGQITFAYSRVACGSCNVIGCANDRFAFKNDLWRYNSKINQWAQLEAMPGNGRMEAVGFSINRKVYIGLGLALDFNSNNILGNVTIRENRFTDFYEYDPVAAQGSGWRRVLDFQNEPPDKSVAFSSLSKGYVLSCYEFPGQNDLELWAYDPLDGVNGSWNEINLPDEVTGSPQAAVSVGNMALIYFNTLESNFWMYIPELD